MDDKMVFIKNPGMYDVTMSAVRVDDVDDGMGGTYQKRVPYLTKMFGIRRVDPQTGLLAHTGYTAITETEFKSFIKDCKAFSSDIASGSLVKFDKAPQEALLDVDLINSLKNENASLKAEIASGKDLLKNSAPRITELEGIVSEKDAEIAALKEELAKATSEPKDL